MKFSSKTGFALIGLILIMAISSMVLAENSSDDGESTEVEYDYDELEALDELIEGAQLVENDTEALVEESAVVSDDEEIIQEDITEALEEDIASDIDMSEEETLEDAAETETDIIADNEGEAAWTEAAEVIEEAADEFEAAEAEETWAVKDEAKAEEAKAAEPVETEEPKTEEAVKEEPKTTEEAVNEESKAEEAVKEEPKAVEEAVKEEPKTEEAVKEEPKTVEEAVNEELKAEETKAEEQSAVILEPETASFDLVETAADYAQEPDVQVIEAESVPAEAEAVKEATEAVEEEEPETENVPVEVFEGTIHILSNEDIEDSSYVESEGAAYTNLTYSNRGPVSDIKAYPNTHINTGNIKKDLISVALTQVGYYRLENSTTKYGEWYGLPTSAWCAMFVSWCSNQAAVPKDIIKPFCRCATEATWFKGINRWVEPAGYIPQEGNIIFFHYNGNTINHVGIVTGTEGEYVYCIEGNNGDAVNITRHKITAAYIAGYGIPAYPGTDVKTVQPAKDTVKETPAKEAATTPSPQPYKPQIKYSVHVRSYGWLDYVLEGKVAGTTGQSLRMEAIKISLTENAKASGGIKYRVHVRSYGWMPWVKDGAQAGTTGESRRMEAIQIMLTGEMANLYDIYYRSHVRSYGWLDWTKNGQMSGTSGMSLRLEAIEIVLVEKGGPAPGSTAHPYYEQ